MSAFNELALAGFKYHFTLFDPSGRLVDQWSEKNLIPTEGLHYLLNVAFREGTQLPSWYIALYEGNYTPVAGLTAATFPAAASECTTYTSATRPAFTPAAPVSGSIDNAAALATFVSSADKTIYGGAILSSSAKGSTSGVIASAVRFSSTKPFTSGSTLAVTAGLVLTST